MPHLPLVYVVMLTYNHCKDTLQALDSLGRMRYPNRRFLLVDNQSTDRTVESVRQGYPEVELLLHSSNRGFAAGINPGIRYALDQGADYVLLVNNDVLVDRSMLDYLIAAVEPDVGAVAPMIYFMDDPKRIWSIGFTRHPLLLEMRGGARGQIDKGHWQEPFDVDYLLGCALLLNSSVLKKVGLFDEQYFFYYEDLDLSWRIKRQGYRLITVPLAKMWHKGSGTAGRGSAFRTYHMARGSVIFFRTHARGWQKPAVFLFRGLSALRMSLRFLASKEFDIFQCYWQGLVDGWRVASMTAEPD